MATHMDLLDIIHSIEKIVNVLEKMVVEMKPKKSSSKTFTMVSEDDYETYIANLNAKYSNIDEIIKIYENMEGVKTKKNKMLYFQKWIHNMLCNGCSEGGIQNIPLRFSANQLYNYTSEHGNTGELQWHILQLPHFINHVKLIIQNILRELRKWIEMPTSSIYSIEIKDCIVMSISEILGIVYNDEDFEKIIKCVIKKLH